MSEAVKSRPLYFINHNDEYFLYANNIKSINEATAAADRYLKAKRGGQGSLYMRTWDNDLGTMIDFGSHTQFFLWGRPDRIAHASDINELSGWISVKDALPPKKGDYIVNCRWGDQDYINIIHFRGKTQWATGNEGISHWMFEPDYPPKEEEHVGN